jgi:RNA ligase (TIGR02306 family)
MHGRQNSQHPYLMAELTEFLKWLVYPTTTSKEVIVALSTHKVEVFKVEHIYPHPNADRLEIVAVWNYQCIVQKGQFQVGDLAAYIPPDSVVPDTPQFSFMWKNKPDPTPRDRRIRAVRLRGILSPGLVIEAPEGASIGDDLAEDLGVTHYEPPVQGMNTGAAHVSGPPIPLANTAYDVENGFRYGHCIPKDTLVYVTEKIHGANARYVFWDGQMYCGSRKHWTEKNESNIWWRILDKYEGIQYMCKENPEHILYGEVYGNVQSLKYGATQDDPLFFAMFDIFNGREFFSFEELKNWSLAYEIPTVPLITSDLPYDMDFIKDICGGVSRVPNADHRREGIVVTPMEELPYNQEIGRPKLKFVSSDYLADNSE